MSSFPSASLSQRISQGANTILERLEVPRGASDRVGTYVEYLVDRFKELWIKKHGEGYGGDDKTSTLRASETYLRYLQLNFIRAIREGASEPRVQREEDKVVHKVVKGHEESLGFSSFYPKAWRFEAGTALRIGKQRYGDSIVMECGARTLRDLTISRLWFARNQPRDGETTWELYQRYDPSGERAMHQGHFYSLLPNDWRKLTHYKVIQSTYQDCVTAEEWFKVNEPLEGETTWELYHRYDPHGERAMNQAQFYTLLPRDWQKFEHYQHINATYEDCVAAQEWFNAHEPLEGETTWELYQRYDPRGERAMHQAQFHSLLPRDWRKLEHYQTIQTTYQDCVTAEEWFKVNEPLEGETTWELYQRYDPRGERAMHQAQFYSLLPKDWRKFEHYQLIHPTYKDCVAAQEWFKVTAPLEGETTWELYQRYDPRGERGMNQAHFYSLLPMDWREFKHYEKINATYQDCVTAEEWFKAHEPLEGETAWELYQRYDPRGERAMHQGQFYSLLPRDWRKLNHYQQINATYEDCVASEEWFKAHKPLQGETTWELYQRFDPRGERAMHQSQFFSVLPRDWRKKEQYQCISAPYQECKDAELWALLQTPPEPGTNVTDILRHYDPLGAKGWNPQDFHQVLPAALRERTGRDE